MVYDFEIADNASELVRVLNYINLHGYQLVAVSQSGESYTVFFGRPADG
jgi:hypothetical protein